MARGIGALAERGRKVLPRAARWVVAAFAVASAALVFGAPADVARGLAWLQAQVQASGVLSAESSSAAEAQAKCETAVTLLKLAGQSAQVTALVGALESGNPVTETLGCWQQLRAQLGQPVQSSELDARRAGQQGWGAYQRYGVSSARDSGFALAAQLQSLGTAEKDVVLAWLGSQQSPEGFFSSAGRADLLATAVVVRGLQGEAARSLKAADVAAKAANWLLARRNAQGNWIDDVAVTAIVFEAVHPYTGSDASIAAGIESWLTGKQAPDGSWSQDPYVTAVALRALALVGVTPVDPGTSASATVRGVATLAATAQPAVGVSIQVQPAGGPAKAGVTDSQGRYQVTGITPGALTITAGLAGYNSVVGSVTVAAGAAADFSPTMYATGSSVPSTAHIRGKVLAFTGSAPIAGATVQASGAANVSGTTDAQGVFDLTVPGGAYVLGFSATGYVTQAQQVVAASGANADLGNILLKTPPTLSVLRGVVSDLQGKPIAGATVGVVGGATTTTNSAGGYMLSGVAGQQFTLRATAPGYASRDVALSANATAEVVQDVRLPSLEASYLTLSNLTLSSATASLRQDITATATVTNPSSGASSAIANAQILDAQGKVLATVAALGSNGEASSLLELQPAANRNVSFKWYTGSFPPGEYRLVARLVQQDSITRDNPSGNVVDSQQRGFSITTGTSFIGSVTANPPVMRAGTNSPVKLSALVQNDGNAALPAQTFQLSAVDVKTSQVVMTRTASVSELPVQQLRPLAFDDWIPTIAGNLRLELTGTASSGKVTTTLYVGDSGIATFTVDKTQVPAGDQKVRANITVTGESVVERALKDPLGPLVQAAVRKTVRYADEFAYNHYVGQLRCYACHVQTQSVVGGERSLKYAQPLVPLQRTTSLNGILQNLRADGSLNSSGTPSVETTLALWATTEWHDQAAVLGSSQRMAEYLVHHQQADGRWTVDDQRSWWRTPSALAALNVGSLARVKASVASRGRAYTPTLVRTLTGVPQNGGENQLSVGKDGALYIAGRTNGQLVKVAPGASSGTLLATLPITSALPLDDGRVLMTSRTGVWMLGTDGAMTKLNSMNSYYVISDGAGQFLVAPSDSTTIYRMNASGALTPLFTHDALYAGAGAMVLLSDGTLAINTSYPIRRVQRFTLDGQLLDFPVELPNGVPVNIAPYRDGVMLGTSLGSFYYNKDWVAERLTTDYTGGAAQLPDGRVFVGVRDGVYLLSFDPAAARIPAGTTLAAEDTNFTVAGFGKVRYGAADRYLEFEVAPGTYGCNGRLGDPGVAPRSCWAATDIRPLDAEELKGRIDQAIVRAEKVLLDVARIDQNNNNIDLAFQLWGLGELRKFYQNQGDAKAASFDTAMQMLGATLRARQHADGGWGWMQDKHAVSDSMVTAIVGLGLDYVNPSKDSPEVRSAVQLLLARQQADGTWDSENGIIQLSDPVEYHNALLIPSTMVEIWLPTVLDRLGGIDTDLKVTVASNVELTAPDRAPTSATPVAGGGTTYVWKLVGVTEASQQVSFDATLKGMQMDETRPVAASADLIFNNSFVQGENVTAAISVPKVSVGTALTQTLATNKASYTDLEQAIFTATIGNGGTSARDAQVRFTILDASGQVVDALPLTPLVSVPGGGSGTRQANWPVGGVLSGAYTLKAELLSATGTLYATSTSSFTVTASAEQANSARINTDRVSYTAAQNVQLTSRVANLTSNTAQDNLQAVTTVTGAGGTAVYTRTEAIQQLAASTQRQFGYMVATSGLAAGSYTASVKLLNATGGVMSQGSASFTVLGTDQSGVGLSGLVQAPATVQIGQVANVTLTATNSGNSALANTPVVVRIVNPQTGAELVSTTQTYASWPQGGTQTMTYAWTAQGVDGQVVIATATATVGGREVSLGQANIQLVGVAILQVQPTSASFAPIYAGESAQQTITVSSAGSKAATGLTFALAGNDASQFVISGGTCLGVTTMAPGATCTLVVSYRPRTAGSHTAEVRVSSPVGQTVTLPLAGQGKAVVFTGNVTSTPAQVDAGQAVTLNYTVSNPSTATAQMGGTLAVKQPDGQTIASWPLTLTVNGSASYAGNQTYTVGNQAQTLTVVLSQQVGTATAVVGTTSFVVTVTDSQVPLGVASAQQSNARILVLVSCPVGTSAKDDPACVAQRSTAIQNYLSAVGFSATVVSTAADFTAQMRCGAYNTYWISNGALKLDPSVIGELRAAIWRGEALWMDGVHDSRNQLLHDAAGVKQLGKLSQGNQTAIYDGAGLFGAGQLATVGQPTTFELTTGHAQALFTQVSGSQQPVPAVVSNAWGQGRSLLFAFDLAAAITADSAAVGVPLRTFVGASGTYAASGSAPLTLGDPTSVHASVTNQGSSTASLSVTMQLPAGFASVQARDAQVTANSDGTTTAVWKFDLAKGATANVDWLVRARASGTSTVSIQVHSLPAAGTSGTPRLRDSQSVTLEVKDAASLVHDALVSTQALDPPAASDKTNRKKALDAVAQALNLHNQGQYEAAIASWLDAMAAVENVTSTDTKAARTAIAMALEATTDALCVQRCGQASCQ